MMKLILTGALIFIVNLAAAQNRPNIHELLADGGGTSGGGNIKGISASAILTQVKSLIFDAGETLYPSEALKTLEEIFPSIKVIMIEDKIDLYVGDKIQPSNAFSIIYENVPYIFINIEGWESISNPLELEALIHHELMVLLNLEETGVYTYTHQFEKLRVNYWKFIETQTNVCSIVIFEKQNGPFANVPGKLLGSSASSITYSGSKGDMGILMKLDKKKALIWRGVIDSIGYFKMQIDVADFDAKTDSIDLSHVQSIEPIKVYSNPYSIFEKETSPVNVGNRYWVIVNCNRF